MQKYKKFAILILFFKIIFLCYTYSGIAKARDNSPLLVFTDADAKDAHRLQEVIDAAIAKNISVTSLLTNQCSRRKRSDLGMLLFFINYISNKYKNKILRNNIPGVVVLLHSNIISFFPLNKFLTLTQLCCVLSREAAHISFIVFGMTLP
jgi:hypothetical protein